MDFSDSQTPAFRCFFRLEMTVFSRMFSMAKMPVAVRQDPARMRPSDTPVICCDHSRLTRDTGWEPEHTIEEIVKETIEYYRTL